MMAGAEISTPVWHRLVIVPLGEQEGSHHYKDGFSISPIDANYE